MDGKFHIITRSFVFYKSKSLVMPGAGVAYGSFVGVYEAWNHLQKFYLRSHLQSCNPQGGSYLRYRDNYCSGIAAKLILKQSKAATDTFAQ